jgi:branched-chain amino acid transport system permease protein
MTAYILNLLVMATISAIGASALNLLVGYTGVFSSAQATFYGVGGYAAALVSLHLSSSVFVALPITVVVTVLASVLLALPASRVTGEYFVVASLAFAVVAYTVFSDWTGVTGGAAGLFAIPRLTIFGARLATEGAYLGLALVCLALVVLVLWVVVKRLPLGRKLAALRDDPVAAQALGANPFRLRLVAVAVSAGLSGVGGMVYAGYVGFIDADSFSVDASILFFAMVILGGVGTLSGPIIGAVFVTVLPALLENLNIPTVVEGPLEQLLYGVAIIVLMIVRPAGLASLFRRRSGEKVAVPAGLADVEGVS